MTTYVYETIPKKPGEKPRYFEFKQRMSETPLTKHPETGEPIRRVVLAGLGILTSMAGSGDSRSGCGPNCGCH